MKHIVPAALLIAALAVPAFAGSIPSGWSCNGACGTDGADGVVPLSPFNSTSYEYITTTGGITGVGYLPSGKLGSETNGSVLSTLDFSAPTDTLLNFYFDYVTSDGAGYADYAWAALMNASNNSEVALLFTARTEPPPANIVPGTGMPPISATLNPSSVPIQSGTTWSPLGSWSGMCWDTGCGNSGWVDSQYTIGTAGSYYLEFGVTNWLDEEYDSGMAIDGVTINGQPINPSSIPEPSSLLLLGSGLTALAGMLRRRFAKA